MFKTNSPNCLNYNGTEKTPTSLFTYYSEKYEIPPHVMMSCQEEQYESPDSTTLDSIVKSCEEYLFDRKGDLTNVNASDIDIKSINLKIKTSGESGKDILEHKMASSCAPHYDTSKITSYNKYTCNYLGTGVNEHGNIVKNPFKTWSGMLPSCENSIEISPKLEHDVKKLVYERAGGDDYKMNVDEFICNIISLPFN